MEPAVSAALDFKAMLEAALRGPSFPCMSTITLFRIFQIGLSMNWLLALHFKMVFTKYGLCVAVGRPCKQVVSN